MRSVVTVSTAATATKLTTLERVKAELSITDGSKDVLLNAKIDEASSDAEAFLGFAVARETVVQTFWHEPFDDSPAALLLNRTPVASISSVVLDDVTLDATRYRYDAGTGELFALDVSGYPSSWCFCKSILVTHAGGYLLPGQDGRNLPVGIEGGVIDLVSDFWLAKGRDASVKSVEIPGVIRRDYWVGSVGEEGELPPRVQMKLAPFRRAPV